MRLRLENAELRRRIREYDGINAERGTAIDPALLLRSRIIARSWTKAGILFTLMPVPWMGCTLATRFWLVGHLIGVVRGEAADRSLVQLLTDQDARVAASLYAVETAIRCRLAAVRQPLGPRGRKGVAIAGPLAWATSRPAQVLRWCRGCRW